MRWGYLDGLQFQTVMGNSRAKFRAIGVPIVPKPRNPMRILNVEEYEDKADK